MVCNVERIKQPLDTFDELVIVKEWKINNSMYCFNMEKGVRSIEIKYG